MALAPLVAPLIGGVLQTAFGWRSNFVAAVLLRRRRLDHGLAAAAGNAAAARAGAVLARLDLAVLSPVSGATRGFVVHLGIAICCLAAVRLDLRRAPSCCRTSTASRRSRSDLRSRSARRAIWSAPRLRPVSSCAGARSHHRLRRRRDGARRFRDGRAAGAWAAPAGADRRDGLPGRHGAGASRASPARCCRFPTAPAPRHRCSAVHADLAAAVGAIVGQALSATAWPLAIAMALAGCLGLVLWWLSRGIRAAQA